MSTTKKVLTIIFSIIVIGAFAFLITWGIINWNKVKEGMQGNGLYTQDELQSAYEDGFNAAQLDKDGYDALINEYKDTITTLTDTISQLRSNLANFDKVTDSLELQIANLTQQKEVLEQQVEDLRADSNNNLATIVELENEIIRLEAQINALKLQQQNHNAVVTELHKTIADLQTSIEYYEQYIASLETGETVVATFEFDGKVYSIQVVTKGSTVSVTDPKSTEGIIFNGWTVDGEPVTLSEYPLYKNTKFVADVSYKYVVNFTVDGAIKSTQLVDKGGYAETPSSPKKANYTFKYWTLDGETEVQLDKYAINCDTTFIAKFARLFTVDFVCEGETLVSRRVEENTTTNPYHVASTEYKVFNGWMVNGKIVEVANYLITQDTQFVASISYFYKVTFMVDNKEYDTQTIANGECASLPATPSKGTVFFDFWTLNGTNEVDVETYAITQDTTFIAKFFTYAWQKMTWNGLSEFTGSNIWTDGVNVYYSNMSSQYVLNRDTNTWSVMTWTGIVDNYPLSGSNIWTDGVNYYLSSSSYQYVLHVPTHTWSKMTWYGLTSFNANNVWFDGDNYYYSSGSSQFVLDVSTHTWSPVIWKGNSQISGNHIWTDGVDFYYSYNNYGTYKLDKSTKTWSLFTFNGLTSFQGSYVWSDGERTFYSDSTFNSYYVLDVATHTWIELDWIDTSATGGFMVIWTDGTNYYFSSGAAHFILLKV